MSAIFTKKYTHILGVSQKLPNDNELYFLLNQANNWVKWNPIFMFRPI